MITLLSTVVSFLAGGLPKLLDFFQDKSDKKHELELMAMQVQREAEMAKVGYLVQEKIAEIELEQTAIQETSELKQSIYNHDIEISKGASQWVIDLRSSVRPVITYCMFGLLCFINVFGCWYAMKQGVDFATAINLLWSEETAILFASIISFWFGGKAFSRR